tara:strand:- start:5257 stop:6528 length:1272 start_codon:yes stop_codon:yes gene_type:complete
MDNSKLNSLFDNMAQQLTPEHMEKMLSELNMTNDYSEDNQGDENQETKETQQEDQYDVNDFDIDSESDISDLSAHEMEKVIIKDINVLVSSLDRAWFIRDDEDIYNFQVHLGTNYNNTDFTKETDAQGNLIREIFSSENFLNVKYKFKNVVSVGLERLIVDNRKFNIEYTDVNRDFADYPYLSVSVDNLDSLVYGTNETSNKAIGIMVAKTPIMVSSLGGCAHYEFTNIISNPKQFYNNPLASLNKLNINIKTPTGQAPNTLKDVLTVSNCGYNGVSKDFITIQTSTNFYEEEFKEGDIIQFKNFVFVSSQNNISQFNEFINRKEGHRIINTDNATSNANELHNLIKIPVPQQIDRSNNNLKQYPSWYSNETNDGFINNTDFIRDNVTMTTATGKLINVSNQTNLLFKIKIMDKESQFMTALV